MGRNQRDEPTLDFTNTNYTEDKAMDCNAAADAEICDVLATLIKVLQEQGLVGGTTA